MGGLKTISSIDEKFDVNSFIDLTEAEDFINKTGAFKDILLSIDGVSDFLGGLKDMIKSMIDKFMDIFNSLRALFNGSFLKSIIDWLTNFVSSMLSGFGFNIADSNSFFATYNSACNNLANNLNNNNLTLSGYSFSILASLNALICVGQTGTLSIMKDTLSDSNLTDGEVDSLLGGTISSMLSMPNDNSISFMNEVVDLGLSKDIRSYDPNITANALSSFNNDKSDASFDTANSLLEKTNPSFKDTSDISIFSGATKYRDLSESSLLSSTPSKDEPSGIDNRVASMLVF